MAQLKTTYKILKYLKLKMLTTSLKLMFVVNSIQLTYYTKMFELLEVLIIIQLKNKFQLATIIIIQL